MKDIGITNVIWTNGIYHKQLIDTGDRTIRHNHFIDENGEVTITVNGTPLGELNEEPLFTNTFETITA